MQGLLTYFDKLPFKKGNKKEIKMLSLNAEIREISAREILDSRGNPTVEAKVILESGAIGKASVPSGASTGSHEACELRDNDERFGGKGVLKAVDSVNTKIMPSLVGISALDQSRADSIMIALDGTGNKSNLGANAILSVSLALARAAACHLGIPLYRYLGGAERNILPVPMMNIINGGAHANNNLDIQEFMIIPHGAENLSESVRMGAEVYASLKKLLLSEGLSVAVGDEGGFAPKLSDEKSAVEYIIRAIEKAGFSPENEISIGLDVASSEWYNHNSASYLLPKAKKELDRAGVLDMICDLTSKYPIISVEDGMAEDDFSGWRDMTERLGGKIMLVGDDLFVTNKSRLDMGITKSLANAILIKPNQIGTVSEVIETVDLAKQNGYRCIMSHRSGETADTFIADFAVALGCEFIKTGAPARAERVEKYNRLMEIESGMFSSAFYGDMLNRLLKK